MQESDFTSLADIVRPIGGAPRDKAMLIYRDQRISYGEMDRRASRLANWLIARGVVKGDRVALLARNSASFLTILFAIAKAGGIAALVNWRLSPREVDYIVGDAEPALIFVERGLEELTTGPLVQAIDRIGFEDLDEPRFDIDLDAVGGDDPAVPVGREDVALLIYTSGTTGRPKGAMIRHGNLVRHCGLERPEVPRGLGIETSEICLAGLPLFHIGGLELLLRPIFTGGTVVLHRDVDVERMLVDIERHRITMVGLVPTVLQMLLEHPRAQGVDFSHLDKFIYGAAPIPLPLLRQGLERMRCKFIQSYGMTEAAGTFVMLDPADHADPAAARLRSAGRPAFDAEVRILDEAGADVPTGQIGEVAIRGSGIMQGYWRRPEATAETIDADGWLRTGDAGYLDADGFVYVADRVKDMIQSGAENIYPAEVESAIFGHPAVAEVAVVGRPDPKWGETVHAVVAARPGAEADGDAIIAWARERIATFKAPRSVEFVDALPKNATGKILRREVRDRVRAAAAGEG